MKNINKEKDLKIFTDVIEQEALEQIDTLLSLDAFKNAKVRIMPDVHAGNGCVIGFTADLGDKVIPNIVGVDIGCGMLTINLGNIEIDLEALDNYIKTNIPHGRNIHSEPIFKFNSIKDLHCYDHLINTDRFEKAIGSLGGGNHFIEIDVSSDNEKYLIIHSGSRNLGNQVAKYYQDLAIEKMKRTLFNQEERELIITKLKQEGKHELISKELERLNQISKENSIEPSLCYLTGTDRELYLHDMRMCQYYAMLNRETIAKLILGSGVINKPECGMKYFHTIHNYFDFETNIVRKGAISSKAGELLLIPINMRDGCILGVGKGNKDWNESAPHGAGRIMSRSQALKNISLTQFKDEMKGVYTTCINDKTVDEAPMVYKSINDITENIKDSVDILEILKPIYNFKSFNSIK